MQTEIIYNGVTIRDVLTDGITHNTVKDSTGVDQIGVRVAIDCTGIVHTSSEPLKRGAQVSVLAEGLNALLAKLTKDRRQFTMKVGSSILYDVQPGAAEPNAPNGTVTSNLTKMDIEHGPKPSVQVMDIKAGYSATIRFRIEFTIPNCGSVSQGQVNGQMINLRFWIAEDVDCRTWLTTRTYHGRIRVAHKHINPHLFSRTVSIPPLQRGFRRRLINHHESENGLELEFTYQDEEIIAAAPWDSQANSGATDWSGKFQILSNNGMLSHLDINMTLTGPKSTPKTALLTIAMRVFSQKTHYLDLLAEGKNGAFLEHFAAEEDLTQNTISLTARIKCTASQQVLLGLFGPGGQCELGAPLGDLGMSYDPELAFHPGTSATLTGLFLSLLQTPCSPRTMPQTTETPPENGTYERETGESRTESGTLDPYQGEPLSESHLSSMYFWYTIESDLIMNHGQISLPGGAGLQVVTLHPATGHRVISIEAERVGLPPELPAPNENFTDANGITHTRVGEAVITGFPPQLSADSRKLVYRAEMKARYAMSRLPAPGEAVPVGCLPYRSVSAGDASRSMPSEIFVLPARILA